LYRLRKADISRSRAVAIVSSNVLRTVSWYACAEPRTSRALPFVARHTNEHRECLLAGTLQKSHFSAVRTVVDPTRKYERINPGWCS
jgi:hypothetical protein